MTVGINDHILMAAEPGLAQRTLDEHRRVPGGCLVCGPQPEVDGAYPCEARSTATRALYLTMAVINMVAEGRPHVLHENRPLGAYVQRRTIPGWI